MKQRLLYLLAILLLPQDISASILVGKTEGNFSVSPSGAATYTIPITIQNGLSDFAPQISLSYNSQAGNGITGLGWSISGLSAISIVPRNVYFDNHAEAIYRGEDNAFALDGMRLLLKSGNNGQPGAIYRTENERYSIISITDSLHGTPATFQVKSTDGSTYKYGSSSGRYALNNGEIYQWALDYAEDVLGNYISYSYSQEGVLYPTSITYGRNTHGTNGVNCEISFNYENRPDSISSYILGYQSYLKKRLKSIVCKYNGNTYRTYTLNYSGDTFSRLISVTESGTSSSTLRPTTFEWNIPDFQVSCDSRSMDILTLEDFNGEYFFSGDLDGDGITEIISTDTLYTTHIEFDGQTIPTSNVFYGRKWNPENQKFEFCYSAATQRGIPIGKKYNVLQSGGLFMHASHGEKNSLVFPYCKKINNTKNFVFDFPKEGWYYSIPMKGTSDDMPPYMIFDANRDGINDIFIVEKEQYHSNNDTYYPAYLTSCNLTTESFTFSELSFHLQGTPNKVRCADFNSDGMADLLITTSTGYYIYWNRSGSFSDNDRYYGTAFGKCDILEAGDFNGDGLPDLIINNHNSTQWYIARNTGNENNGYFALQEISYLTQVEAQLVGDEKNLYCIAQDIDGDGKSDAVVGYPHSSGNGGHICILKSNGNTLTMDSSYDLPNSGDYPDVAHVVVGNLDGHGGMEIMYLGKGLGQNTTGWHLLKNPSIQASSQKMISITDGLGAQDSISYGLLTDDDVYSVTQHHSFPLIRMAGSLPVVTSRKESIPSESRTTNYSYANGIFHLQGKGFIGFKDIKAESSTGIVTDTHSVLDNTYYVLLPDSTIQSNTNGVQIKFDHNTLILRGFQSDSLIYTTDCSSRHTEKLLDGFEENEGSSYGAYGYPIYQYKQDDLFTVEKDISYWECPHDSIYIKGLPEEIDITKSGGISDDVYESLIYERDPSTGLILKETRTRNGQTVSTDGYSYNEYGQMTMHYTVPYNSTDTLVSRYVYNSKGQLTTEYDPKGLSRSYTYNSQYGTLTSVVDFDGVQTQYTYDGFFREKKRMNPIETIQTTRANSNYGNGKYSIKIDKTGETSVTTHYDAWERKVAEASYLANSTLMYQDYQYLPNGKVGFVSFPHKRTEPIPGGTNYTYDDAQRLVRTEDSNNKTSTWSYSDERYVTSTIDGISTSTYYHTPEKIHVVEHDPDTWIEYFYNADGTIATIETDGYETEYEYDTYGRLIRTTDMNGVTKEYSYDSNGYPYRTTIAGSIVETNYDKFGILRSKSWTEPGEAPHTVNYTYNNRFRLIKEESNEYRNTYSYDQYGRMTQKGKRVTDSQMESFNVLYQYSGPRITGMNSYFNSYPPTTDIIERFSYQNGYNVSDTLNNTSVWQLVKQDRWGNATEESIYQGTLKHTYDDYGNMLTMRCQGTHPLISELYTYNVQTGNMSSKNNTSLTYDSMNRLIGWGNYNYSYDAVGNITHQPFVGDFSYNGYKVTGMSADSDYSPDDSLRISYYKSIERPRSIEDSLHRADFYYDGNGDRIMMKVYERHAEGDSLIFTRYYMDANAEVTLDTLGHYTHLYYAGGDAYTAPAVMVIDELGNSDIYQICRDNLGSVLRYANANGVRYNYTYSPWGVRTHQVGGSTVFYQPGEDPSFGPFFRTYTGHEDLWMFGLLNANARLYSPYLGRFVSPDPLLTEEGSPLDFNPYVYARNNPYRYIDRNGEFWFLPILINAVMNVATYSISAAITGNWNVGDFFKSMGIGAVTAGLDVGMSLLGTQLSSFGNTFAYGLLSNMVNNTITNTLFGEKMSFGDIPGMVVGATVSTVLPRFSPTGTNLFKNVVSEIGINTLRGTITGAASGAVNALVHDDTSLMWKGAVGGAISGFVRSTMHNAIFGAAYQPLNEKNEPVSYGVDGVYRKGGIGGFLMNKLDKGGDGVTLGRYAFTVEKGEPLESVLDTRFHENIHLQQIERMGFVRFYGELFRQYLKEGIGRGALEKEAYENQGIWRYK